MQSILPLATPKLLRVQRQLERKLGDKVRLVSISVDRARHSGAVEQIGCSIPLAEELSPADRQQKRRRFDSAQARRL
jgi:hypothetical protein